MVDVKGLKKYFPVHGGLFGGAAGIVKAVDGVSFKIGRGRTLGLVGESGSGKTTVARILTGLLKPDAGEVSVTSSNVQMIFQDPASSLDPRMRARDIILEGFHIKRRKFDGVEEILKRVGLGPDSGSRFPHEFSGGERQRIAIARAMATRPEFIVCDEPVSSLDVSMQEEILNLLKRLQAESDLTYLFISHDLAAVEYMSDDVAVMYQGKIAECGDCRKVCRSPEHPYTKRLIESVLTFSLSPFWGRG